MSTKSLQQLFREVLEITTDNIWVQCPCRVESVNGNYVNVLAIVNDEEIDVTHYNVPIKRDETKNGYLYFQIVEGDYGTLRFYDRSIEDYKKGDERWNGDFRQHSIQDKCFELGFIPDNSAYQYTTTALIELGCKDGLTNIQLNNGEITINSTNVVVNTTNATMNADNVVMSANSATMNVINTKIKGNIDIEGNVDVIGTLSADVVIPRNGASGAFTARVDSSNGIVTGGA